MIQTIGKVLVMIPFLVLFVVMTILALGPSYLEARQWWMNRNARK